MASNSPFLHLVHKILTHIRSSFQCFLDNGNLGYTWCIGLDLLLKNILLHISVGKQYQRHKTNRLDIICKLVIPPTYP